MLWSCFLVQILSWSLLVVVKIHFASHVMIQLKNSSLLLGRIREDDASKWQFFWFLVSSWGTYLVNFFTFPICFKCQMTVEWSTLISLATSHIVVRGPTLMKALSCSLSTSNDCPLCSSTSRHSSPLQSFLNHHCTGCVLAVPEPNALLRLQVVFAALLPILDSNKKIAQTFFLSNIIALI